MLTFFVDDTLQKGEQNFIIFFKGKMNVTVQDSY